ncbi:MAG TPA: STN and carboxypeptidase regulatory-like domain-containing protein [Bacteroidales bacterium]|nr:STN and carboxypeptidase regulatory-like domain-containing protein [Bacteroidales bacterium]
MKILRNIISFFSFLTLIYFPLNAQDSLLYQKVSLPDTVCTVETALKMIEQATGLSFSYNSGLINKKRIISLKAENEELEKVLRRTLVEPALSFSIIGRHLVIYQPQKVLSINAESHTDSVFFFEIRGVVLDKADRQTIPYSSIYLVGKTVGIISNDDGQFVLKLSSKFLSDTLNISSIGYKNFSAPVASLVNTSKEYLLKTDFVSIQEVIIRKLSPVTLLQSAVGKINENYPQKPVILNSFYRESIKRGNHYLMVSEALLENFKPGYGPSFSSDQIKIVKGRKSEDIDRADTLMLKLKAGLNTTILLDVVKNLPDFMTGQYVEDYSYRLADIVIDNGVDNYAIEFKPREMSMNNHYSGRILLGVRDLAFKWIEFYVDHERLDRATDLFIVKKPAHLKIKMLKANYRIAFRQSGSRYYLHLIQCETEFRIRSRNQLSGNTYATSLEMAVTDIDTVNTGRFRLRETARVYDFFTEQVGSYDDSFWGEYNFIKPDESLEDALIKLGRLRAVKKDENLE